MTINDLNSIKSTLISEFDDFWNYNILEQELKSEISHIFVAISNKEIIGFAAIKFILDEAELMNIATKKSYRKCGIGSNLLSFLIEYAKSHEINSINLEVNYKNLPAISLYKKYNFKKIGIRKKYYNNVDDAVIMKKNLVGSRKSEVRSQMSEVGGATSSRPRRFLFENRD